MLEPIVACDFCIAVTATFRMLYIFVVVEHGSRRILHSNVTPHPTAEWTLQQLREAIPSDHDYGFLIHDRDSIFSSQLDQSVAKMGLRVLKTPYRSPQANSLCERTIGSMRRECLDYFIPLSERHLRIILKEWVEYFNHSRPHMALGPGVPDPPSGIPVLLQTARHCFGAGLRVMGEPVLSGLHHEYSLVVE